MGTLQIKGGLEFKVSFNMEPCLHIDKCQEDTEESKDCMFNGRMYKCERFKKYNQGVVYTLDQI